MPLHMSSVVSRRKLDHPHEKTPVKIMPPDFVRVLKYNPNHGPDGRFSSGRGGGGGGTSSYSGAKFSVPAGWPQPGRGRSVEARAFGAVPMPVHENPYAKSGPGAVRMPTYEGVAKPGAKGPVPMPDHSTGVYKPAVNPAKLSLRQDYREYREPRSFATRGTSFAG